MDYSEKELGEYLHDAYWKEGKTLKQIGVDLDMTAPAVFEMFEKYNIRTRNVKRAIKLWWKQRKKKELSQ